MATTNTPARPITALTSGIEAWKRNTTAHRTEARLVVRDDRGRFVKVTRALATDR